MKKRYIFGGIAVLVIAIAIGINVNLNSQKSNNLSVLSMANIEVLATENENCPGGSCASTDAGCSACCPSDKDPICTKNSCGCKKN
ncbi:MAG: NVEALA domain-containing protein [Prevotellaceae bacterium]|jgi:hypothetical protein|nr:NVEALA domain-containing protein [Prevotellaceae bacterium]